MKHTHKLRRRSKEVECNHYECDVCKGYFTGVEAAAIFEARIEELELIMQEQMNILERA